MKIETTPKIETLINNRSAELEVALFENNRLYKNRWHGNTSLYDAHRINNFITDVQETQEIDVRTYDTLCKEVKSFSSVISPNLFRALNKLVKDSAPTV